MKKLWSLRGTGVNDTEYQGIRYFSLLSTGFEEVNVKTESSVRYVIIHQDLELPPVLKTGRLFSFRHGEAGQRINPVLETLFNNPRKRVHSFRRTFKLMYRDEGMDEHSIDALTGHARVMHQRGHTQGLVCLGDMSFYLG